MASASTPASTLAARLRLRPEWRPHLAFLLLLAGTTAAVISFATWGLPHGHVSHENEVSLLEWASQALVVILVALLWFIAFAYRETLGESGWLRNLPVALTFIPAGIFAASMRNQYNTAVFVMALGAIFVAAEHLRSLDDIAVQISPKELSAYRQRIYESYAGAGTRIDAVLRVFDIDANWSMERQQQDEDSLLKALTGDADGRPRRDKVLFVGHLPQHLYEKSDADSEAPAAFFEMLLGIVWRLLVIERAGELRGKLRAAEADAAAGDSESMNLVDVACIRMRIAVTPIWMHAVDDYVYQVKEELALDRSHVTLMLEDAPAMSPKRHLMAEWAHQEIRRCGRRGVDAVDYVCCVLRYAVLARTDENAPLSPDIVDLMLRRLGMVKWLAEPATGRRAPVPRLAASECTALFEDFIARRLRAHGVDRHQALVEDLARDLV